MTGPELAVRVAALAAEAAAGGHPQAAAILHTLTGLLYAEDTQGLDRWVEATQKPLEQALADAVRRLAAWR